MSAEFAKTYSTSELSRKSGDIIADALRAPVAITQRGKTRLVILSAEDFQKLMKAQDRRKAYRLDEVPRRHLCGNEGRLR